MSVLFETSVGDIVVDLEAELCPKTSENFLKLCKTYRYNFCAFFNVQKDYIAQTGDPTDSGSGGQSIYPSKYFEPEIRTPALKHSSRGTLSMAVANGLCGSQFFFTLADSLDYLDGRHAVFGRVVEGWETLDSINDALLDDSGRPLRDIRLRHVVVLDDPFPDPPGLVIPPNSPVPTPTQLASLRIGDEEELDDELDPEEVEKKRRERDARAQALTLEMVGDLPFAEVAPPENVLFVCKLNAVTRSEDLELIFSRFGRILSCEVIKDKKTGDSLQYAFIEFEEQKSAEQAYFKMDNVLIDDRRIHVDFSQSVSRLHSDWVFKRTGGRAPPSKSDGGLKKPGASRDRDDAYEPKGKVSSRYGRHADDRSNYPMTFDGDDLGSYRPDRRQTGYDDQDKKRRSERSRSRDRWERRGSRRGDEHVDRRDRSRSPRRRREGKARDGNRDPRR